MEFHKDGTLPTKGEVFVFGSNLAGIHGAGAAKIAKKKFGAIQGQGRGLMGQSYAIATKDAELKTRDLELIRLDIRIFNVYTTISSHANTRWFVNRVGCGLAGLKDEDIAPMFLAHGGAINCSFPEEWRKYLES